MRQMPRLFTPRDFKRLPKMIRIALSTSLFLSVCLYGYIFYYLFLKNHVSQDSILQRDKCPLCFGNRLCSTLVDGRAKFQGFSRLQFLNSITNIKNVHFGSLDGKNVVFKKLAHNSEFTEFDDKYRTAKHISASVSGEPTILEFKSVSKLSLCPTKRMLTRMLFTYEEKLDAIDFNYNEKIQLFTTLMINPEPIVLQMFPQAEGYPFPKYYGACGRLVVVENVGTSIADYHYAPWETRVKLAHQIFHMAEQLSNTSNQFAVYLTDVSYDNFVVSEKGKVYVVDLEHVAVVDIWQIQRDNEGKPDNPLYVPFDQCGNKLNCISVPETELCSAHITDFNYYAVCRNLLSSYASQAGFTNGLLHDVPEVVDQRYHLTNLLNQCAKPDKVSGRLEVKVTLVDVLKQLSTG